MKKLIIVFGLYFLPVYSFAQEVFIDHEKDKEWINTLENKTFKSSDLIKKNVIKIDEYFGYVNKNTPMKIEYNSTMESYINKYLNYKWLPKTYGLLKFYEPLFEMKLKEYNLPLELKYLPIVESNLNPQGGSHAGAGGLWQFMPATGKEYGMVKNEYINLFYDPYLSTDSACKYITKLWNMYKDWNLVLSAYNYGQGNVNKAIKKAGTKSYWKVREYLPAETRAYAPSFHAVKFIGESYSLHYNTLPIMKYDYTKVKEITVNQMTNFTELSKSLNTKKDQLYFLNPHILTEIIPKGTFVYYIKY